jgi:hypothetical protein
LPVGRRWIVAKTVEVEALVRRSEAAGADEVLLAARELVKGVNTAHSSASLLACQRVADALAQVTEHAVAEARSQKLSWEQIGFLLGMTKQAAWEKYAVRNA